MKKKIVISTLVILSFLMMTVIGISPSNAAAKKEFVIGSVGCMSGPGAMLGKNMRIGVEFAVDEMNKTGGINGMKVRAVFRDDEGNPTNSLTLVRELVEREKIDAFIGPTNTTCALAIQPYLVSKKILQLNGGTTGTALVDPVKYPYSFRTHINDKDQAIFLVAEAIKKNYKRIAVAHDTSALGMGVQADMKTVLQSKNMEAAIFATYNAGDVDMLSVAQKLKAANPDIILMFTLMADGARILKALEKIDFLPPKVAITGYVATALPIFRELAGTAAKGVWSLAPTNSTYTKTNPGLPKVIALAKKVQATYPGDKGKDLNLFTIFSYYDCAQLIRTAVTKAKSLEIEKLKAALESLDNYRGAQGDYQFSATDHEGLDPDKLSTVDANQLKHGMYLRITN